MKNVLTIPSIIAGSKNSGATGTTNYNDLTNKPQINGVTLSGNKTAAELGITTLTPFPSTWPTTGKFEDLLTAIKNDPAAEKGASFLGEVTFSDLPAGMNNAEVKVEILHGTTADDKVIHSVITSGNTEPYRWEYTSWNNGESNSGWISFQLPLTAGTGIEIENNTISATVSSDNNGIKGDYASKYGIINCQNGLITYSSDSKEVTIKAGIQLLMPGSDTKTQIGSDIKYTINSASDVTLFLAEGTIKEAEAVYYQKEEPENGQEAYLAWFSPEVGKWQFKSNADGNVWKTPTKAGPLADVHLSETGVIRVDYIGYRVLNDQIFALKGDIPSNIYTFDNLIAGENISIDEVLPEGGIDEHTVSIAHLDTLLPTDLQYEADILGNLAIYSDAGSSTVLVDSFSSSFGKAWKNNQTSSAGIQIYNNNSAAEPAKISGNTFTADFWVNQPSRKSGLIDLFKWTATPYSGFIKIEESSVASNNKYQIKLFDGYSGVVQTSTDAVFEVGASIWNHIEISVENNGTSANVLVFINGTKAIDATVSHTYTLSWNFVATNGLRNQSVDEIRISNIVRHTENFVPPTKPYEVATPTGKVAINNAITKTSQLTNDSGFITSLPDNIVTTDTQQTITGKKTFNTSISSTGITNLNGNTYIQCPANETTIGVSSNSIVTLKRYARVDNNVIFHAGNISTSFPKASDTTLGAVKVDGTTITADENGVISTSSSSSSITSVNDKTGTVVLTGADIQTTYKANPEAAETTSDINAALTTVCEDIHNVLTNVPTGAEIMSTTVYPYQAPLATDATLADVITKVNTILAIMSERGIMKKNS